MTTPSKSPKKKSPKRQIVKAPPSLRYIAPENIAKDFKSKRERAAIAAVFEWFSLNTTVAWELKPGVFTNNANTGKKWRDLDKTVALIMVQDTYDRAYKLLGPKRKP